MDGLSIPYASLCLWAGDIYEAMGYGKNIPDESIREMVNSVWQQIAKRVIPRYFYHIYNCEILSDSIRIGNTKFSTGKIIAHSLKYSEQIAVFVATAGLEYEQLVREFKEEGDCTMLFILDSIGTCLAECAGDYMERILEAEINLKHTNRFSPGYCGWHVSEQHKLFSLLPEDICGVQLSDSSLMFPIKSISGFIGIGPKVRTNIYSCNVCEMKVCFRKR